MGHDHPPVLMFGVAFDEVIRSVVDLKHGLTQLGLNLLGRDFMFLEGIGPFLRVFWRAVDNDDPAAWHQ